MAGFCTNCGGTFPQIYNSALACGAPVGAAAAPPPPPAYGQSVVAPAPPPISGSSAVKIARKVDRSGASKSGLPF